MLFDTLALISLLFVIILLRRLVNVFPSLIACIIRWKESVNLEMSVKLSRDRNLLAAAMVIPFSLTAYRFHFYDSGFMTGLGEAAGLGITIGIFTAYILLRNLCTFAVKPDKSRSGAYNTADAASRTFFIILTLVLLTIGGILSFAGTAPEAIRSAIIWVSAVIYIIFLLRKTQIFASSYNFFTVFLYLCALEIAPTGVLVTSVLIFK